MKTRSRSRRAIRRRETKTGRGIAALFDGAFGQTPIPPKLRAPAGICPRHAEKVHALSESRICGCPVGKPDPDGYEPLVVVLSPQVKAALETLHASGLHGLTVEAVAEEMIRAAVRDAIRTGWLETVRKARPRKR